MIDALTSLLAGMPAWQATAVVLALSLGGAVLAEVVIVRTALGLTRRTETGYDNILVQELRLPIVVTVGSAGAFLLTRVPAVVESVVVSPERLDFYLGKPAVAIILLAWAWAANRIVDRVVGELDADGSNYHFAPVLSNVWTLAVAVGTAAGLLALFEIDVAPLLGAAGIAGVAVGFAAKDTVANFFGGIALYFDDTYRIGDYVVLEGGEAGTVVKVGIRSTTLLTRDEVLVTVPNSVLNAARIVNESAPQRRKRVRVPIGVAYGTDVDAFEALVVDLALAESLVLDSPKPRMRFRAFGDSALRYELLCWVHGPTRSARAIHELNRAIYKALGEADIEIPYPRRDVSYRGGADPADDPDDRDAYSEASGADPKAIGANSEAGGADRESVGDGDPDGAPKRRAK